jgi:hypothetical protein
MWERGDREDTKILLRGLTPLLETSSDLCKLLATIARAEDDYSGAFRMYDRMLDLGGSGEDGLSAAELALMLKDYERLAEYITRCFLAKNREASSRLAGKALVALFDEEGSVFEGKSIPLAYALWHTERRLLVDAAVRAVGLFTETALIGMTALREGLVKLAEASDEVDYVASEVLFETIPFDRLLPLLHRSIAAVTSRLDSVTAAVDDICTNVEQPGETIDGSALEASLLAEPPDVDSALSALGETGKGNAEPAALMMALDSALRVRSRAIKAETLERVKRAIATAGGAVTSTGEATAALSEGGSSRTVVHRTLARAAKDVRAAAMDALLHTNIARPRAEEYGSIPRMLDDAISGALTLARERGIVLNSDIDPSIPRVRLVTERVLAAFTNVLLAAVRSQSKEGSVSVSLTRDDSRAEARLCVLGTDETPRKTVSAVEQVVTDHGWRMEFSWTEGDGHSLTILIPLSKEQHTISTSVQGYARMSPAARQALTAAEALFSSGGDIATSAFLFTKALELEIDEVLSPLVEPHSVLPKALQYRDTQKIIVASKRLANVFSVSEREAKDRFAGIVDAAAKARFPKEMTDWRSMAFALQMFGGASDSLARAIYKAGEARAKAPNSKKVVDVIRQSVMDALPLVIGQKAGD